MKPSTKQIIFWAPRLLTILFAAFISLFAFDVFDSEHGLWETIFALLIHLIPTGIILLTLLIAWQWEWVGAVLFIGLGLLYLLGTPNQHWSAHLLISGPSFMIGTLFLVDWWYKTRPHLKSV